MADDNTDAVVESEITLDDFNADEQQPAKADSTPAADAKADDKAEAKDTKEEKTDDTATPPDVPTKTDTEDPKVDETVEDKPQGDKSLAPKSENRFQKLANENRSLKEQVEKLTGEVYQPQTAEELSDVVNPETGENYTKAEARVAALEQKLELKDYNERITNVNAFVGAEAYEVLQQFPIFNDTSDQYDPELAEIASETMEANLVRDPNVPEIGPDGQPTGRGIIIGYNLSPKQIYTNLARIHGVSATKGQLKGQADTEKQLANVDAGGNAAPPKEKVDPLVELWKQD